MLGSGSLWFSHGDLLNVEVAWDVHDGDITAFSAARRVTDQEAEMIFLAIADEYRAMQATVTWALTDREMQLLGLRPPTPPSE